MTDADPRIVLQRKALSKLCGSRSKYHRQGRHIQGESILRPLIKPLDVDPRGKGYIKPKRQAAKNHAELHEGQVLAGAAELAPGEGDPGGLVGGQVLPPLGDELQCALPVALVSLDRVGRDRDDGVARDRHLVYLQARGRRQSRQACRDGWLQAQGFLDDVVEVRDVLGSVV